MDKTAFKNKIILGYEFKCCKNPNLDRNFSLCDCPNLEEKVKTITINLRNSTNFECKHI